MINYTVKDLRNVLEELNLSKGDIVYVETFLYSPGKIKGINLFEVSSRLYSNLRKIIGEEGTIVVPTPFRAFTRGEEFNIRYTKCCGAGSFSEYIRNRMALKSSLIDKAVSNMGSNIGRSSHAIYSLCADGRRSLDIVEGDVNDAFGKGGHFYRLVDMGAKFLTFGGTANSKYLARIAETIKGVLYRKWAMARGRCVDEDGQSSMKTYHHYEGAKGREPALKLDSVYNRLNDAGKIYSQKLGTSVVESCLVKDYVKACDQELEEDVTSLLLNPQDYISESSK